MKKKIKNAILKSLAIISFFIAIIGACAVDMGLTARSIMAITAAVVYLGIFVYVNRRNKMFTMQDVICDWE